MAGSKSANCGAAPSTASTRNGLPSVEANSIVPVRFPFSASTNGGDGCTGKVTSPCSFATSGREPPSRFTNTFASFVPGVRGASRLAFSSIAPPAGISLPARSVSVVHLQLGNALTIFTGVLPVLRSVKVRTCEEPGGILPRSNSDGSSITGDGTAAAGVATGACARAGTPSARAGSRIGSTKRMEEV